MNNVSHHRARHHIFGVGDDFDPLVVLHLGDGPADDVDDRHRAGPSPPGNGAGEDDQALGVTTHPGGEVIKREKVRQRRAVN